MGDEKKQPVVSVIRRMPATLTMVGLILVIGVLTSGLWSSFDETALFKTVAYGLPNLTAGRVWTPITGAFFVNDPWVYPLTLVGFVGMGYLEFHRGSRVALAYYWVGQLFAVFATSLLLLACSQFPWEWAHTQAAALDIGASGGTMACLAAAIGLFRQPWRVRAWLVLLGWMFISILFWGAVDDLEHLLAVLLILFVDRSLRLRRTTVREQRLIALVALFVLGTTQIITFLVPTDGPFGRTDAQPGGFRNLVIDAAIILIVASGLRRGRRWAWILAMVPGIFSILQLVLVVVLLTVDPTIRRQARFDARGGLEMANALMWLVMLGYLIWMRRAFRSRRSSQLGIHPAPTSADVKQELRASGGGTLSWMTTWSGNRYLKTSGGFVAYQRRAGVALALGDPIGPPEKRATAVAEFIRVAEQAGLAPCFFSADESTRAAVPSGWRNLVVANDTIVDLQNLAFTGKRWNSVRTSMNRGEREEMTFRITHLKAETWGTRQQLRAISEEWVGEKDLPEMRFTLGTLEEAADPEVRIALALAPNGDVDGFLSWLPVYGPGGKVRGWTLDLMRRREGGFGPVMEFLIGSSAMQFSAEGAEVMSLSGAPLAHDYPPDAGVIAALSDRLAEALEPVYGFRSLHKFKQKFNPRYETMYLLYRDESDMTGIGRALTRAFLPDATLRQFASAGLGLVRGTKD